MKYFISTSEGIEKAEQAYDKLVGVLKKNRWFKFLKGRINEDKRNHDVFVAYNIYPEDDLEDVMRKLYLIITIFFIKDCFYFFFNV